MMPWRDVDGVDRRRWTGLDQTRMDGKSSVMTYCVLRIPYLLSGPLEQAEPSFASFGRRTTFQIPRRFAFLLEASPLGDTLSQSTNTYLGQAP
jgi:hypothetical protein